ncbi:MAG: helix-turn-helix transcriptional regulator [Ignavibacteriae bacterium]|nr:helix-turn-helix transcriptional regulator [Ignavibacteria bacterium]MBI3365260.1 helix-turn-helix transcriptional regulator [Ignavibacteriota bacterium]
MVALPCSYLTLKTGKPRNPAYPEDLKTLGDHIRKRRLDLGMHQKDVAKLINTTTSTITNWEKNRTSPRLRLLPSVFGFLGYNPLQSNPNSLGEKIKQYRIQKGLSLRRLAKELGIDPGTLERWERKDDELSIRYKDRLLGFFDTLGKTSNIDS